MSVLVYELEGSTATLIHHSDELCHWTTRNVFVQENYTYKQTVEDESPNIEFHKLHLYEQGRTGRQLQQ